MVKKIGIAADHGGFRLKEYLMKLLTEAGYEVTDFGNTSLQGGDDYPDFVIPLARAVAENHVDRGIAICGSGVGACIAANKIPGARACLIHDKFSAQQGVEDDDMNIMCLGGRVLDNQSGWELTALFLTAKFSGESRHKRRIAKVAELEKSNNF